MNLKKEKKYWLEILQDGVFILVCPPKSFLLFSAQIKFLHNFGFYNYYIKHFLNTAALRRRILLGGVNVVGGDFLA